MTDIRTGYFMTKLAENLNHLKEMELVSDHTVKRRRILDGLEKYGVCRLKGSAVLYKPDKYILLFKTYVTGLSSPKIWKL